MAEYIRLNSSVPNTSIEFSLQQYEPIAKEMSIDLMKVAKQYGYSEITLFCKDAESLILASTIAHILNSDKLFLVRVISQTTASVDYMDDVSHTMIVLVINNINQATDFSNFYLAIMDLAGQEEIDINPVILTLSKCIEDNENLETFVPQVILDASQTFDDDRNMCYDYLEVCTYLIGK